MLTDIEIAQAASLRPIAEVAAVVGVPEGRPRAVRARPRRRFTSTGSLSSRYDRRRA